MIWLSYFLLFKDRAEGNLPSLSRDSTLKVHSTDSRRHFDHCIQPTMAPKGDDDHQNSCCFFYYGIICAYWRKGHSFSPVKTKSIKNRFLSRIGTRLRWEGRWRTPIEFDVTKELCFCLKSRLWERSLPSVYIHKQGVLHQHSCCPLPKNASRFSMADTSAKSLLIFIKAVNHCVDKSQIRYKNDKRNVKLNPMEEEAKEE